MSALEERRQRAREAFFDEYEYIEYGMNPGLDDAIETATRVKITDAALEALHREFDGDIYSSRALAAALAELGFEVEP